MNIPRSKYQHGFLGAGKMAEVLLRGLRQGLAKAGEILVSRRSRAELTRLRRELRVRGTEDNRKLAAESRWIWLGIKPFQASEVLTSIAPHLRPGTVLLSMMAGVSLKTLRRAVGPRPVLIRLMPNTPACLGQGMTGVYFEKKVSAAVRNKALRLLGALGQTLVVSREAQLNAVTGLSGSGPAFVYYLAEALAEGGHRAGLRIGEARLLAFQTMLGAARMLQESGVETETLIRQVLSKGGTTEAGLRFLKSAQVGTKVRQAVMKAARRAAEIQEANECSL